MQKLDNPNTVGKIIKTKRLENDITLEEVEFETKIKQKFLEAIEEDKFNIFDSHTIAKGFIKNFSRYVGASSEQVLALYRRDVENKDMKRTVTIIKEDENIEQEIFLNRIREFINNRIKRVEINRRNFFLLSGVFFTAIAAFFILQIAQATFDKPFLKITNPLEIEAPYKGSLKLDQETVIIRGQTENNTLIKINDQIIPLNPDFSFQSNPVALSPEPFKLKVTAESNLGVTSKIELELVEQPLLITQMNIDIKIIEPDVTLFLSTDNIIRFDDFTIQNSELNFQAERQIILKTNAPNGIVISINGASYSAAEEMTILNLGEEIVIK